MPSIGRSISASSERRAGPSPPVLLRQEAGDGEGCRRATRPCDTSLPATLKEGRARSSLPSLIGERPVLVLARRSAPRPRPPASSGSAANHRSLLPPMLGDVELHQPAGRLGRHRVGREPRVHPGDFRVERARRSLSSLSGRGRGRKRTMRSPVSRSLKRSVRRSRDGTSMAPLDRGRRHVELLRPGLAGDPQPLDVQAERHDAPGAVPVDRRSCRPGCG